ncbi:MAG: hypothetical protein AAGF15_01500 [Pseudomonadota bacterium]
MALLFPLAAAANSSADKLPDPIAQFDLPRELREVSGLAVLDENTVVAHDDERARIFTINLQTGSSALWLQFGKKPVRGDFEGIARLRGFVYLMTSRGALWSARAPGADEALPVIREDAELTQQKTGLAKICEVEGLSAAGTDLAIVCKAWTGRKRKIPRNHIRLFIFEPDAKGGQAQALRPVKPDERCQAGKRFAPSALVRGSDSAAATDYIMGLAAEDFRLWISRAPLKTYQTIKLNKTRHPQAEGLAVMPDGRIVIVDEQEKGDGGLLTVYPPLNTLID